MGAERCLESMNGSSHSALSTTLSISSSPLYAPRSRSSVFRIKRSFLCILVRSTLVLRLDAVPFPYPPYPPPLDTAFETVANQECWKKPKDSRIYVLTPILIINGNEPAEMFLSSVLPGIHHVDDSHHRMPQRQFPSTLCILTIYTQPTAPPNGYRSAPLASFEG